jgi:3-oxoacyl-[acyl-carrier protein] reductase
MAATPVTLDRADSRPRPPPAWRQRLSTDHSTSCPAGPPSEHAALRPAVTVNAVLPTATDGAGYFTAGNDDSQLRSIVQNASPIGSRMGTVDDVADAVQFFTSELARWISGQQLLVSGGAPS